VLLLSVRAAGEASERLLSGTPQSGSAPNCFINVAKADATGTYCAIIFDILYLVVCLFNSGFSINNLFSRSIIEN
jgi:hypothetical protein